MDLFALLGSLVAGWLVADRARGPDLKALYFLGGMLGYPLICLAIGAAIEINGVKVMAFGFLALAALFLIAVLGAPKKNDPEP